MERKIVRPEHLDLESPGRRDYLVALEHDHVWRDHLIPLTVFVGPQAKPGVGLVAFGSTHGNEYEGPVVLKHLLRDIDISDVEGRIILVPVLNPAAFRAGTRQSSLDDGVNLNRAFVDGAGRTPALSGITHRIVDFVRTNIWPHVDIVIDLHSGGYVGNFALCSSFHEHDDDEQNRRSEEAARWFGVPLVMIYQNLTPGLLPSEAERMGKLTIGTELGWGASCDPNGVRYGRQGVLSAAIRSGLLRGEIEPIDHHRNKTQVIAEIIDRDCYTIAPFTGHYEPLRASGTRVGQGEIAGYLHDFEHIDAAPWPVRAGVDGVIVAQAALATVPQGQHILVTGYVRS